MIKHLGKNILIVFLGIFFSSLIMLPFATLFGDKVEPEIIVPLLILLQGKYFIAFYLFFNLYDFLIIRLIKKDKLFLKLSSQLIIGIGCMFIAILTITVYDITIGNSWWGNLKVFCSSYGLFIVFVPVSITINYFIVKYSVDSTSNRERYTEI